jgi:proteic killer suppression protein
MIKSFADAETELLWNTGRSRRLPSSIRAVASRKLAWLNAATDLNDLRIPPANHLEVLRGDRKGQHSIRVNDKYRLCFKWRAGNAEDVEIVDYH